MFNPLLPDFSNLKNEDLETKISDLGKKYFYAARSGQGGVCHQISVILEVLKEEQQRRYYQKHTTSGKNQTKDMDDLINIDK